MDVFASENIIQVIMEEVVEIPEFELEIYHGNVEIVNNLEEIFKNKKVRNSRAPEYLLVRRPLFKIAALKKVYITNEDIIEQYNKEINEFFSNKIYVASDRLILIFIKDSIEENDLMDLKGCIVFDKQKSPFLQSIEVILMDSRTNKAYFDGLKVPFLCLKYRDTKKILLKELGFVGN